MKLCSDDCIPCCDFCIHAEHDEFFVDGKKIIGGPVACNLHNDEEHNETAEYCGYCDDFYCFMAEEEKEE